MKKTILLLSLWAAAASCALAQQYRLAGTPVSNFRSDVLQKTFERYTVFSVDVAPLLRLAATLPAAAEASAGASSSLDLRVEFGEIASARFSMTPSQVLAEGYQTLVSDKEGVQILREQPAVYPFRTALHNGESAALTIADQFLYGSFEANGRDYFVEPLWYFDASQPHDRVVVYESGDVKERHEGICGTEEVEQQEEEVVAQRGTQPNENCGPPQFLDLAIANDYQMVTKFGSVANVITHNIATMNAVQTNWDDDFALPVTIQILTQFVPASALGDPFTTSNSRDAIFTSFLEWALAGGFGTMDFDLAHWRSPRIIYNSGNQQIFGAAYQNGLCGFNTRFAIFSEVNTLSACGLRTVTSHEMGHSFGCPHTPSGGNDIMTSPFNGCTNTWAASSVAVVNSRIPTSLCMGLSPSCPIPNSIPLPPALATLCTGTEECFTYTDNLCVGGFNVTTNDPYLQVIVWGAMICLQSTAEQARIATVMVTPLDYCGNPANNPQEPSGVWQIQIDWGHECGGLQGPGEDRAQPAQPPTGLKVASNSDFFRVEDIALEARNKDIRLFDQMGRLLLHQQSSESLILIPLGELPAGILVARVASGNQVLTQKVVHF